MIPVLSILDRQNQCSPGEDMSKVKKTRPNEEDPRTSCMANLVEESDLTHS
jgi:hypothetical protein